MTPVPRARRLGFGALAALLGLVVLEGASRLVERALPPPLPAPAPGMDPAFLRRVEQARRALPDLSAGLPPPAPPGPPTPLAQSGDGSWSLTPGATLPTGPYAAHINSLGLRGPELSPRAPREQRLLTLGDSSVFGDAIPDERVFERLAAEELSRRWSVPCSSANGGVPGYASGQARERLAVLGPRVQPTIVVIATLWSDLYAPAAKGGAPGSIRSGPREGMRRLALWRMGRRGLAPWLPAGRVGWVDTVADMGEGDVAPRTDLAAYGRNLEAMAEQARALGARAVFLALPAPVDLDREGPPPAVRAYRARMAEAAQRTGGRYVDAPAYFRDHGGTIGHFLDQVHPGMHGHDLLAEALVDALASSPPE